MKINQFIHPSGRPTRDEREVRLSIPRIPRQEPLTPRLQRRELAHAIGFHAQLARDDDDD